jgi:hypothetical protein
MSTIPASVDITPRVELASVPAKPEKLEHHRFGFSDLLDIVNPLQHIPVISTLYRKITGDTQSAISEIAGGALFGGIVGAVTSVADVLWTQATGNDFGNTVMAWLGFEDKDAAVQVAETDAPSDSTEAPVLANGGFPPLPAPPVAEVPIRPPVAPQRTSVDPRLPALISAMEKEGVDPETAMRAATAYRDAIGLVTLPIPKLTPAY